MTKLKFVNSEKFEIRGIKEKYLSIFLKLVAMSAGVTLSVLAGGQAKATNFFTYTKIADTNTPIPGGNGNFSRPPSGFPAAFNVFSGSVDGNNIVFQGFGSNSQSGIYTSVGGVLKVVADTNTPIPGGSGNFGFGSFGQSFVDIPSLDGGNVAFFGRDSNSEQQGIYTSIGGVLNVAADTNTPIPNGSGNFDFFFGPSLDGNTVAFGGDDPNFEQQGVYTSTGGALNVVANTNTPIPNGNGNFSFFGNLSLDGNTVAFGGFDPNFEQQGIYTNTGGVLNVVADTNTPIPNGNGNFSFFGGLSLDSDTVAFLGYRFDPDTFDILEEGIYTSDAGILSVVADLNTFLPDRNAKFCQFDPYVSLDGGNVVFGASGCDPVTGDYLVGGIYAYLNSKLTKVIDFDDSIDGKEVASSLFAGSQALSGDSIAFWVRFTDGSNGIYLAQKQTVDEPNSALGLLALGTLGGVLMLKRKR